MGTSDDEMTPEQVVAAWIAMGPSGDRARVEELIKCIESTASDIIEQMGYLSDCREWEEDETANKTESEYVQDQLSNTNDPKYILARCRDLRELLNRIMPPNDNVVGSGGAPT